jgi:exonuclease SbcC
LRDLPALTSKGQLEKKSATGEWVAETGSIKQMDTAIEEIVGLTFEGFTRAVILPQGKFDEFLSGDTNKRRDVVARQNSDLP